MDSRLPRMRSRGRGMGEMITLKAMTLKGKHVLFFAGPLYEDLELWYPKIRLEEEGAGTTVAGLGEKTYQGKRGYPVTVDTSVDQIDASAFDGLRSEEHTSELQSQSNLVCRLLLEKKKKQTN